MFMTSEQMTAEQRVQKAIVSIMQTPKYIALAGILMLGERVVVDADQWKYGIPTACTNGKDEMYHRDFVGKLNDAELRFLILRLTSVWTLLSMSSYVMTTKTALLP